ncbi:hypothetical protein Tco_1337663 [Tanacetum coccineum]
MLSEAQGVSLQITSGMREDPNRDGERGFDYLTSAIVSSKAHREGCRASHGRFPYWGDLRAEGEDSRLRSKKSAMDNSFTLGSTKKAKNVKILKTGLRMAFDPTQSLHYKLVDSGRTSCDIDIQIYSLEIGNWSMFKDHFNYFSFDHFDSAIYWNDALHWLETENRKLTHYILDIEDHEHPIITTIQIPQWGMNFLQSYGYIDPIDDIGSSEFTIYEMMKGCSIWSVRYRVDTDDFMTPLHEGLSIRSTVWRIVLGEREEDSLSVINLPGKVVQ